METNHQTTVQVGKAFPVPVEVLYQAWISPESLKQWCNPLGNRLTEVRNEVREGGELVYRAEGENEGSPLLITGQYEEVKEAERLVYSWNWKFPDRKMHESLFRMTVTFARLEDRLEEGSRIEVKQEALKNDEALSIHEQGWEIALDSLYGYLAVRAPQD